MSPEACLKISQAKKGSKASPETCLKNGKESQLTLQFFEPFSLDCVDEDNVGLLQEIVLTTQPPTTASQVSQAASRRFL